MVIDFCMCLQLNLNLELSFSSKLGSVLNVDLAFHLLKAVTTTDSFENWI